MSQGTALNADDAGKFIFAGRADFAVVSTASDSRLTFRAKSPKLKAGETSTDCRFLYVQTGGEGRARWAYMGWTKTTDGVVRKGKTRVSEHSAGGKAIRWVLRNVVNGTLPGEDVVKVFHCGRCGRCGRKLTDPVSIATGFGPHCTKEMGKDEERKAAKATVGGGKVRAKDAGTLAAAEDDKIRRTVLRKVADAGAYGVDVRLEMTEVERGHANDLYRDGLVTANRANRAILVRYDEDPKQSAWEKALGDEMARQESEETAATYRDNLARAGSLDAFRNSRRA